MTPEQAQALEQRIQQLEQWRGNLDRPDRLETFKDIIIRGGSTLKGCIFAGAVDSGGTFIAGPPGWTISYISGTNPGEYTITHNLGNTNYIVVASPFNIGSLDFDIYVSVETRNANTFKVRTTKTSATTEHAWFFI